jgi:hypothetical protein
MGYTSKEEVIEKIYSNLFPKINKSFKILAQVMEHGTQQKK